MCVPKPKSKERFVLVSVHVPKQMVEELDGIVRQGYFPSRSEAIRIAVRDLIMRTKGNDETPLGLMPGR